MAIKTEKTGSVSRSVLDNGLVVLSEDLPTYQSASIGVWVNVGSKHESDADAGVSHFIEHMLFKGTPTRSAYDIADIMEGVGGYLNGTTDKEQTCYSARVMDKHLDLSMDLIADMMRNSLFDTIELNREKNVVVDEIKTYEDSPPDVIHDMFLRATWGTHPLGRSTIGTEEVVMGATREQLMRYLDEHYKPDNMVVTVAGRVDHERLLDKTQQWFGQMKRGAKPHHMPLPPVRPHRSFRHRDTEQVYVCLGGEGLKLADEDKYKLQVLDNILGGGMSPRLFQEIREQRGLVYNIGSFIYSFIEGGVFGIYVVSGPDSIPEVMGLLRKICEEMRVKGVTQREYERSKEYLKGSFALGLESSSYRMMRLIRSEECYGRFIPPEEIIKQIDAVTLADVNDFARRFLDLERYCVTALGPFRGTRKKNLKAIASGAWEEDIGPYDKPRPRRRTVEHLVAEGVATGELPPPPSHVHVG